jgi:tRNA A-37 threonylcarbamoyl transferase component Bud32
VRKLILLVAQAGPRRVVHVLSASYVLSAVMWALRPYAGTHVRLKKSWQWGMASRDLRRYRLLEREILAQGRSGYRLSLEAFGLSSEDLARVRASVPPGGEAVLGELDQDGLFRSVYGPVAGVRTVTLDAFFPRKRFSLTVVTDGTSVGVRKDYREDQLSFVTELKALHHLAVAGCRVPAILSVDFSALTITFSYIKGRELRLELAEKGAVILDRDILQAPGYDGLSPEQRRQQQIDRAKPHLAQVVDRAYVEGLFEQLRRMHGAGFIWKDIKYGNMLMAGETGEPWLIDFDTAYDYRRTGGLLFRLLADRNIEDFNRCFGTTRLTYERIRAQLRLEARRADGYSPAYFGYGLRSGNLLKNYVGDGRWHFMMKRGLPRLPGARLLDLGSNDAFHSLQCLRHGASQAIAVERDSDAIARGLWFKEVFEWTDNRTYDFRYVQTDMGAVPEANLGRFDFVMALCSIYYLDDAAIASLIRYLSTVTDTLLLMCNTEKDIARTDPHEYIKASVPYTVSALSKNGFPETQVIAPSDYSRPLVTGRTSHG